MSPSGPVPVGIELKADLLPYALHPCNTKEIIKNNAQ